MYEKYAQLFKVLSDPNRIRILELLIKGETCSCTLIDKLPISQPTLSYHLKMISNSGLAQSKKDGNWIKYFVNKDKLSEIIDFISKINNTDAEQCDL